MVKTLLQQVDISIHAPRGGSDNCNTSSTNGFSTFQSTLPVGGATFSANRSVIVHNISIHAPRGGSDPFWLFRDFLNQRFQSTLPVGGATAYPPYASQLVIISIHAPRGGSDHHHQSNRNRTNQISIHAPRGGSDFILRQHIVIQSDFNPRSPWGERPKEMVITISGDDFNPRSPWGERRASHSTNIAVAGISIHAPRGGSDMLVLWLAPTCMYFNPRSPWGERHPGYRFGSRDSHFNPRSPWGERPNHTTKMEVTTYFNPRSPWGERPGAFWRRKIRFLISIHAPRGGSDRSGIKIWRYKPYFNPRSPWGERLCAAGILEYR